MKYFLEINGMTKHNLLQVIQDYSNLAYKQGEVVGSRLVTLEESREEEGFKRLMKFLKIADIVARELPSESIESRVKERFKQ